VAYENTDEQYDEIRAYFDKIIKGYVVHDIQSLIDEDSGLDELEVGGCAAPLAMCIFSAMNQLGYLTSNRNTDNIEINPDTELCIKEFCEDWMSKVDNDTYQRTSVQEILVNFFRHGLAHQYMPISYMAITRHPKRKGLLETYEKEGSKFYILQVKILAEQFLHAITILEKKIAASKSTDEGFKTRFYNRLMKQRSKYLDQNKALFKKAAKNLELNNVDDQECTTTTSGTKTQTQQSKTTYTC
jgi:hypothetical protein